MSSPRATARRAPRVIAHRGASAVEPEHTLRAYQRAIDMGADGVECDVRLTRDGVLVCIHDRTVERTSDGAGVVSTMTVADLHRLDFGSWKGEPAEVLTLEQLIELLLTADRPMEIAIETKHPTRYGGRVEREVVALLERFGLVGSDNRRITPRVMSFSPPAIATSRRLAPRVPTVQLMQRIPASRRNGSLWAGATIAGPSLVAVRAFPGFVEAAHRQGHEVHVWTVDQVEDVDYLAELGVDAIITNRPDVVVGRLVR
ncbi:MAG TPA: glycerophosphodiester phosphodiesterase [Mycobacteriales bacterium]|nr:glycerophosphodiester phosphodiesterase [Mycobacteriales bacterium]